MEKVISIIVPAFNMEGLLAKDLTSLIISSELLPSVEIIVVNDGSKDKTIDIARDFERRFPGVFVVIDKENGNYGSCINAGLKKANGTFVKIMDADDSFLTENFEQAVKKLIESEKNVENVDLFFFDWEYVDEKGEVIKELEFSIPPNKVLEIDSVESIRLFNDIQHHAIVYRTRFLTDHNYSQTEGVSYSDTEWIYKPLLYVKRIKYFPIIVYSYLFGRAEQSMSPKQIAKGFNSMLIVSQSILNTYVQEKDKACSVNMALYREKVISTINYLYMTYLIAYPSAKTIKGLQEFDNKLSMCCEELYIIIGELTFSKLNIHYVKAFRNNPNGFLCKIASLYYRFRKFLNRFRQKRK